MIKELCDKLKEKRKELGYSIEYVVERTKLHPSMIKDIEEGNLANENPTYVRGFIKIYASFLKIDIGSFLEEIGASKPMVRKREAKINRVNTVVIFDRIGRIVKKISPEVRKKIILVLATIVLFWAFFVVGSFIVGKVTKFFTPLDKTSVRGRSSLTGVTAPAKSIQKVQKEKGPEAGAVISEGEELVATLTAKKKCFLKAVVDGNLLFEGVLEKGARETWRGSKEIEFKIRDGSAIALEVNGRPIPTLTSLRKPIKSLRITSSGIVVDK